MGRFYVRGVITQEPSESFVKGNVMVKTLFVEEVAGGNKPVNYLHKIDFVGKYAFQIPKDILMKGAEVMIVGSLTAPLNSKGIYENLRGEQLMIVQYPRFEEELPTDETVSYAPPSRFDMDDEDLPF